MSGWKDKVKDSRGASVLSSTFVSVLASALGRLASLGVKGTTALGWRTAAASVGILGAGWIASAIPQLLDTKAEASAPSITGSLSEHAARAPRSEWAEIKRAGTTFTLAITELDGQPVRLLSRRDVHSQAREEQLQTGEFAAPPTFARIALRRLDAATPTGFFVDMSRHASESGFSFARASQALPLNSKFGILEAADMVLSDGVTTRNCLIFRHVPDGVNFSFRGWLCGTTERAADRQQLTCLVERINLLASGEDRLLRAHFSKAELQRQPQCQAPKLQAAGRKTSWLDPDQAKPPLRRNGG